MRTIDALARTRICWSAVGDPGTSARSVMVFVKILLGLLRLLIFRHNKNNRCWLMRRTAFGVIMCHQQKNGLWSEAVGGWVSKVAGTSWPRDCEQFNRPWILTTRVTWE